MGWTSWRRSERSGARVAGSTVELVRPAHLWVPAHMSTAGDEAIQIAALAGIVLDPEQELAVRAILSEGDDGNWAALEAAIVEARQNGKTVVLQVIVLHGLFLMPLSMMRLVIWTAHLFSTTQEAFRDLDEIIAGTPAFSRRVKRVHRVNGDEGFELHDGRRLKFRARSKVGGRGLTGDRVVLDEAWALVASEMGSLFPTLTARPNPQVLYASSGGLVGSDMLRSIRDRGRRGGDPSLVYLEWCADEGDCASPTCDHRLGVEGCVLDDRARWQQANPALGRRITVKFLESERRALPPEEFAREVLGWWDEPAFGGGGIPADAWKKRGDREAVVEDPCTLAFDVAPGHLSASIVVCGRALHVTEHRPGTGWVVPRLVEIVAEKNVSAVGMDPTGPAGALIPDLEKAGFVICTTKTPNGKLVLLDGRESVQACEGFLSAVIDGTLVHRDENALNLAVEGAGRRQSGDSWKWSRRDSTVDITPLVAATVARHLWSKHKANPPSPLMAYR